MFPLKGITLLLAFALDLFLGDPEPFPHPVRLMGRLIDGLSSLVRRCLRPFWAGVVLWVLVVGSAYWITWALLFLSYRLWEPLGIAVEVFLLWTCISLKDLKKEAIGVYNPLLKGDLQLARLRLSRIVSRDTDALDEVGISRGTIESVAENTVDGVISPLFYAALGGAPLAMAFKAVSTLDSMVGYPFEPYKEFGKFSARMDDIWNFVPARLSLIAIWLSSLLLGFDFLNSLKVALRDHKKRKSPNAGFPEGAFAGALGLRLGGITSYRGIPTFVPYIGDGRDPVPRDILNAVKLSYFTSAISLAFVVLIASLL